MREGLVTSQHWSCSNSVTLIEFHFSFLLCISHNVFSNCLFEMAFFLFSSLVIELIFHSQHIVLMQRKLLDLVDFLRQLFRKICFHQSHFIHLP